MTFRTSLATSLAIAISLGSMPSALAVNADEPWTKEETRTSDELVAEQKSLVSTDHCNDKTGKDRGRCITDVLKRIKKFREDFKAAVKDEREIWMVDHVELGRGQEFAKVLSEYTQAVNEKRKIFNVQQRELEKLFFSKQEGGRVQTTETTSKGFNRRLTTKDEAAAKKQCSTGRKQEQIYRICLRQQARLLDPTLKTKTTTSSED